MMTNPMMMNPVQQYPGNNFFNPYGAGTTYPSNAQSTNAIDSTSNLIRVTGIDGAKAYQMPPNSTVALFDSNEDVMYVKSTDGAGFPTIRTFSFSPMEQPKETIPTDFVSRTEFEDFKKEMKEYGKQFIQQSKPSRSTIKDDK